MKRNLDIQREWESIGAGFSVHIGLPLLSVPENYFENLPNEILSGIRAISVPDTPFEPITLPFAVPENYFQQLDTRLMQAVQKAEAIINQTVVPGLSKENVFAVPQGYFEQLPDLIMAQVNEEVAVEEELADSPLLASLKGSNPFARQATEVDIAVPKPKVTVKEKPEIEVPMTVRKSLRWSNWVAAAAVALFFVMGASWLHWDNRTTSGVALAKDEVRQKLATISDEAIDAYVNQHIDEFNEYLLEANVSDVAAGVDKSLNNISDEELEAFLYNDLY